MALKWIDGAEIWGTDLYQNRVYASGSPGTSTAPRLSPGERNFVFSSGEHMTTPSLGSSNIWICGFGLNKAASDGFEWRVQKGGDEQCTLESVVSGAGFKLRLMRGATQIAETTQVFTASTWHYFELKVTTRTGTNGAYELRWNETTVLSGSSVNLAESGADGADTHSIHHISGGGAILVDDIYICDGSGSVNNDFLGDTVAVGLLPESDGATNQWTRSAGATNFSNVDDDPTAGTDTDYVSTTTNGHIDLYGFDALPTTGLGAIFGVQVSIAASVETIGARTLVPKFRSSGGTVADGDDFVVSDISVIETPTIMEVNPVTTTTWTASDIDDGQFGVEVTA